MLAAKTDVQYLKWMGFKQLIHSADWLYVFPVAPTVYSASIGAVPLEIQLKSKETR